MNDPGKRGEGVDASYYADTRPLTRRISVQARRRVHELFMNVMRPAPGDRILDIGTSDDTGPDSNMLEQLYPHRKNITCASLSDGKAILAAYPEAKHVPIKPGEPLPFAANSFEIVYSNAVLEHVGSEPQQRRFIEELCRVAPRRFLAVPNRGFPIEHHTCLPLIHYLPEPWFQKLLRGTRYDFWSYEKNLNYISARKLRDFWPSDASPKTTYSGIGFGPWKSNLVIYQS